VKRTQRNHISVELAEKVNLMSKAKTPRKKATLGKMMKRNRRIPIFVIAKTNRRVSQNRERRSWRSQKLKMRSQKRNRLN